MKITAISDTHWQHDKLDLSKYPADVLVHAGDWTKGKDLGLTETIAFFKWFAKQPFKYKICIAGNHELQVEATGDNFIHITNRHKDMIYLNNSEVTIDGIKFYGSPYSNEFGNWAFMGNDVALSKVWAKIPDDTNVLITHGPAYGCNDLVKRSYGTDPHVGSKSLYYRKLSIQDSLQAHISGHIHEAYGISTTKCINVCASVLDEKYKLINNPITIEVY